jgi:GNAT superfamily N-acetyltransferase
LDNKFEQSEEEDLEEILSLINTLNREMWINIIPKEYYKEPFLTLDQIENMATSMEFYVLREDSEIIAVGSFSTRDETTAWIPVMYVRSDFQRKGIGSDLLQFLEEIARGRNFMNINLETDNAAYWAVNFYEKHGYTTFKKDPNPWGHHIWMKKQL